MLAILAECSKHCHEEYRMGHMGYSNIIPKIIIQVWGLGFYQDEIIEVLLVPRYVHWVALKG